MKREPKAGKTVRPQAKADLEEVEREEERKIE